MRVCRWVWPGVSLPRRWFVASCVVLVLFVACYRGMPVPLWPRHTSVLSNATSLRVAQDEVEAAWVKIHKAQELAARAHQVAHVASAAVETESAGEHKPPAQSLDRTHHNGSRTTVALSSFQCTAPISPTSTCVYLDLLMWGGEVRACNFHFRADVCFTVYPQSSFLTLLPSRVFVHDVACRTASFTMWFRICPRLNPSFLRSPCL
jgi:hypothetical protein